MALRVVERPVDWLELSADHRCNNRCVGCFSAQGVGDAMSSQEIVRELDLARRRGARALWLGGGEPTLRTDLVGVVRAARKLGYTRIKLQTNGMRLAHHEYLRALQDAGLTEVNFSIKGATAATHDALADTPGCHELMLRGMREARALGLRLEGDLLVYRANAHELPEMVRAYAAEGLVHFNVWLFSAVDQGAQDLSSHVARIGDVVPYVQLAMDLGVATVTSLHTPPCTVPATHRGCLFFAADLNLLVANPGGHRFFLEESPIEGGRWLERCGGCTLRPRCGGLREDYLRVHGDGEFQPVP